MSDPSLEAGCRIDVWLWRARLLKTRTQSAEVAQAGRIRLQRHGVQTRLDKASRLVKIGDELVMAVSGRLIAVRIVALGARRGPPAEARAMYEVLADLAP